MSPRGWLLVALVLACKKPAAVAVSEAPVTLPGGLVTQTLARGAGDEVKKGDKITVHYVGTLVDGGVFDDTRSRGRPFEFWLGEGMVIEGWDQGLIGMHEGDVRRLIVPPRLGYGSNPPKANPKIPPDATLIFELELVEIR